MISNLSLFIILILFLLFQFRRSFLLKYLQSILCFFLIIFIFYRIYLSIAQYLLWSKVELSKYLLPPFTSITFFFKYVFFQFFLAYLISGILALIFYYALKKVNQKYEERFFYQEELLIASFLFFLVGFPECLLFLLVSLSIYLLLHLTQVVINKKQAVISLFPLWLPSALLAIIIKIFWVSKLDLFTLLRIS